MNECLTGAKLCVFFSYHGHSIDVLWTKHRFKVHNSILVQRDREPSVEQPRLCERSEKEG